MIDTVFYKIDLLVNGHEKVNDLCPVVIEHTTKACCDNAVPLALIICVTIIILAIIAACLICNWNKSKRIKVLEDKMCKLEKNNAGKGDNTNEYISKLLLFREELAKKDSKYKNSSDNECKSYIDLLTKLAGIDK